MEALPYPALATDAPQEVPVSPPQTGEMRLAPSETDRIPHLLHSLTTLSRLHGHGVSPLLRLALRIWQHRPPPASALRKGPGWKAASFR